MIYFFENIINKVVILEDFEVGFSKWVKIVVLFRCVFFCVSGGVVIWLFVDDYGLIMVCVGMVMLYYVGESGRSIFFSMMFWVFVFVLVIIICNFKICVLGYLGIGKIMFFK